jgi:hypothetical protein
MDALLSGRSAGLQKFESIGSSFVVPRFTRLLRHGSVDFASSCLGNCIDYHHGLSLLLCHENLMSPMAMEPWANGELLLPGDCI